MTEPVRISLLGQPLVVDGAGRRYVLGRKTLHVLAYLILFRDRPLQRDSVAFTLFPDDVEETARGHLRRNLSYLLSSLPQHPSSARYVEADSETVAWTGGSLVRVDVIEFERAIDEARDGDAIGEYGGELLPTIYDDWTNAARERLRESFHAALTRTIARDRSRRQFDRATLAAHRLLDDDPWREDIVRALMTVRYEAGDRAGSLAIFERFAARLSTEMHVRPMPETMAVRDAILRGSRLASSEPMHRAAPGTGKETPALPFVGRDAQMRAAIDIWHDAADGRSSVVFVSGPAGIGKSRFAAEFARAIEGEGGLVVAGSTAAGGEHRPYEAFIEALQGAKSMRARTKDVWQSVLEQLLDEYAAATFVEDRSARLRLFDSVRRGLADLAHVRPGAVILEDLHWAGPATVDLLEYVSTRLGQTSLLIVATFRSDELAPAHPLRAVRRQLVNRGGAHEVTLERLEPGVAIAAARQLEPPLDEGQIAAAVARADGVPLLLDEALRDLAAGRSVGRGGIDELFDSRLSRLERTAETALVYGAVIGARFDLRILAATTGWSDGELIDALGHSIELGLIRASSPGLTFAFTHHLVHRVALDRLAPEDSATVHGLVARALVSTRHSTGANAAEIARHYLAAGVHEKALEHYLVAARYALDVFANAEARDLATAGLDIIDGITAATETRHALLIVRERAYARIGDLAARRRDALALADLTATDLDRSSAALERVFETHRDDAPIRAETLAKLEALAAHSAMNAGRFERARSALAFANADFAAARDAALRAVHAFEQAEDARAAFFARSQYVTALCRAGDFATAREEIAAQRPGCEASDDLEIKMEFYRIASSVATGEQRYDVGLTDAMQSLDLALRVGDRFGEARARHNVAFFLALNREYERAVREEERTLAVYDALGDAAGRANTIVNMASIVGFCGDHARAEALLDALTPDERTFPYVALMTSVNRACFALRSGRIADAEPHLVTATELVSAFETAVLAARVTACYGEYHARCGRDAEALACLHEALAVYTPLGEGALIMEAHAVIARIVAGQGDAAGARDHAERAAALMDATPLQHAAEFAWHLAASYELIGDSATARTFAERAARAFVDETARMDAALTHAYAALSWHIHAIAFLCGRPVPLRLAAIERTGTTNAGFPERNRNAQTLG